MQSLAISAGTGRAGTRARPRVLGEGGAREESRIDGASRPIGSRKPTRNMAKLMNSEHGWIAAATGSAGDAPCRLTS